MHWLPKLMSLLIRDVRLQIEARGGVTLMRFQLRRQDRAAW